MSNTAYPKEGYVLWMDNVVLLKDAPNRDNALKFMNFLLDPENAAAVTNYAAYTSGVLGSNRSLMTQSRTARKTTRPQTPPRASLCAVCDRGNPEALRCDLDQPEEVTRQGAGSPCGRPFPCAKARSCPSLHWRICGSGRGLPDAPLRLAVWQGPSPAGDRERGLARLAPALPAAGAVGADDACRARGRFCPATTTPDIPALAQSAIGRLASTSGRLLPAEAGCGLTVGYAERDGDQVYNSAVAFDADGRADRALPQDPALRPARKGDLRARATPMPPSTWAEPRPPC